MLGSILAMAAALAAPATPMPGPIPLSRAGRRTRLRRGRKAHMRLAVVHGRIEVLDMPPRFSGAKGLRP